MEEQEQYAPATEESPTGTPEEQGEQVETEEPGQVEEATEPTAEPEEKLIPLKAAQDERRKRRELQAELEALKKVVAGEHNQQFQQTAKPRPDQFSDYDEYVEALSDWKAEQVFARQQAKTQQLTRAQLEAREEQRLIAKAKADVEKATGKYSDFQDVVSKVVLPTTTLKALYESDLGAELAYYLGKNQADLERIQDLSAASQIREIGKLEAKLAATTAKPEAKKVKQATQVEQAGNGFTKPNVNLSKLKERAIATGDWTDYLEATGNLL